MGPPRWRRGVLGVAATPRHSPWSGGSETFWVEKELFCNLMPLFYRWRDKVPDKPRRDLRVTWRSWGQGQGWERILQTPGAALATSRASGTCQQVAVVVLAGLPQGLAFLLPPFLCPSVPLLL